MVPRRRATAALAALSAAACCYVTAEILPVGLLTVMAADLHRSHAQVGLLVTGYAVVVVIASFPLVRVTQRVPRRHLLAAALAVLAVATAATALAPSYPVLFAARLATALSQALFWAIAAPAVLGLFPPEVRGRMMARLSVGASLAPVLGVPTGTWLGQQLGWRAAFAALAAVCLVICAAVTALVPTVAPADGGAARGTAPDRRRYGILILLTALGVTGALTAYTYVTPFLLEVSGFAAAALGPLLLVAGLAGLGGPLLVGRVLDRYPAVGLLVPMGLLTAALLALFAVGGFPVAAIAMLALTSLAYGALPPAIAHRAFLVAPGSTDMASAGVSAAFNVGIASGSLLGAALIGWTGVRSVALAGALLTATALAVALTDIRLRPLASAAGDTPMIKASLKSS
ncbi:MFS transporter [Actinomycetes bacterium KLBMP 9797]